MCEHDEQCSYNTPRSCVANLFEVRIPVLVQVQDLLHKLVSGEGDGLWWYTADVVERQAAVQSLFNPVLIIHMLKSLCKGAKQKKKKKVHPHIKTMRNQQSLAASFNTNILFSTTCKYKIKNNYQHDRLQQYLKSNFTYRYLSASGSAAPSCILLRATSRGYLNNVYQERLLNSFLRSFLYILDTFSHFLKVFFLLSNLLSNPGLLLNPAYEWLRQKSKNRAAPGLLVGRAEQLKINTHKKHTTDCEWKSYSLTKNHYIKITPCIQQWVQWVAVWL